MKPASAVRRVFWVTLEGSRSRAPERRSRGQGDDLRRWGPMGFPSLYRGEFSPGAGLCLGESINYDLSVTNRPPRPPLSSGNALLISCRAHEAVPRARDSVSVIAGSFALHGRLDRVLAGLRIL